MNDNMLPEPPAEIKIPEELRGENQVNPELEPVYNAWACVNYLYRNREVPVDGIADVLKDCFRELGGDIVHPQVGDGAISVGNGDLDDKTNFEISQIALDNIQNAWRMTKDKALMWAMTQLQRTLERGDIVPESTTRKTTTLVESWGTPWQRITSQLID